MSKGKKLYVCINPQCDYKFIDSDIRDGLSCPKCGEHMMPLRDATLEEIERIKEYRIRDFMPKMPRIISMPVGQPPKQIDITNDSIVILRIQSSLYNIDIKTLEDKYSKKFDCKVVIIEANLQFVDVI